MTSDVGNALRFHSTLQEGVLGKGDVPRIRGVYACGRMRTSVVLCVRPQLVHLVLPLLHTQIYGQCLIYAQEGSGAR